MISLKQLKEGYYYYSEEYTDKYIGKIISNNGNGWIGYEILEGNRALKKGKFCNCSAHHHSIKGISKNKKGLFLYMI